MSNDSSKDSNASDSQSTFHPLPNPSGPPRSFTVVLFPGFELLDATGPLNFLNNLSRSHPDLALRIAAVDLAPVPCKHPDLKDTNPLFSQSIQPTHTYASILDKQSATDVLLIPGGVGTRLPEGSINPTVRFVTQYLSAGLVHHSIFTVCTGSSLLAQTGYFEKLNVSATTNKIRFSSIVDKFPAVNWIKQARWVRDGQVWTTSGVTAGMDGMAAFVQTWWGEETAQSICRSLEYRWCGIGGREEDEYADMV